MQFKTSQTRFCIITLLPADSLYVFNFRPHGSGGAIKVKIEDKGHRVGLVKPEDREHDEAGASGSVSAEETVVEGGGTSIPAVLSGTDLGGVIIEKSEVDSEIYVIVGGSEEQGAEGGEMIIEGLSELEDDGEDKQVNCPECGRAFSKVSFLQAHLKSHTGEKPFECDRCGRSFSQRANLHRHYQGHIGEKPHLCHLCGRSFDHKVIVTSFDVKAYYSTLHP